MNLRKLKHGVLGAVMASLAFDGVHAAVPASTWQFVPTPLEWESWPQYCRVQWTRWTGGLDLESRPAYSATEQENWRATIGGKTYDGLHHWCASMHYLSRSRGLSDPAKRKFMLGQAWLDAEFSYSRAEPQSPVFPNMSVTVAQIKLDMMETEYAIDVLRRSIEAQPSRVEHYGMLANIFRRQGNLEEALKVLNAANLAVSGTSAEIQYNLGLINLERGDYPAALGSAQAAYRLGYPLPWLKDKLTQLGVWKD